MADSSLARETGDGLFSVLVFLHAEREVGECDDKRKHADDKYRQAGRGVKGETQVN